MLYGDLKISLNEYSKPEKHPQRAFSSDLYARVHHELSPLTRGCLLKAPEQTFTTDIVYRTAASSYRPHPCSSLSTPKPRRRRVATAEPGGSAPPAILPELCPP